MILHFISTGSKFPYAYYLAVLSALKTQKVDGIKLWMAKELGGKYFDLVKDKVHLQKLDVPDFPALKDKSEHFKCAHLKDYLTWKILYNEGGICMDLDTFSIQDVSCLIGNKEVMAALETEKIENWPCPFNSAIMIAKKGSGIIKEALDITVKKLNQPTVVWGEVGPELFSYVIKKNLDKVKVIKYGVCGWNVVGGGNNVERLYQGEEKIDPKMRILHLFAYASKNHFSQISPEYIKKSNAFYPNIVKKVLDVKEWKPLWNWHNWVNQRGKHYAPMFNYLENHKCYNILEIGTHNGFNAIGMIKTSLAPENGIHYFGFDLFKTHDEETKAREFTQDYHKPPSVSEVKKRIEAETKAKVSLFAGDSKKTLLKAEFPKMDFIYIDGGHSIETISADWKNVQKCIGKDTVIFFDDYFDGISFVGCLFLEEKIDKKKYHIKIMPEKDIYPKRWGDLVVQLMIVEPISKNGKK